MPIILNIDTATDVAHISIAKKGIIIDSQYNFSQKDHATFLQPAIQELCIKNNIALQNINAVAVTAGPGSYTGLRVGLSSAKGLCFALNIPLITISTLAAMAKGIDANLIESSNLICPMIDARRLEVFTAIYNTKNEAVLADCAMVLTENILDEYLQKSKLFFFGNGATKWQKIVNHPNAFFNVETNTASGLAELSYQYFLKNNFANLAYSEPFYLKEFKAF